MTPQRHQQPQWSRFQGGQLPTLMEEKLNYWVFSLQQHFDELGMEILLTPPKLLIANHLKTHHIADHRDGIPADQKNY